MNMHTLVLRTMSRMVIRLSFPACMISPGFAQAGAGGEIFPAEPAAQAAVNWKDGYFFLNGKPTFISSGSLHYSRVPRELWRDRVWRINQMGFNCVQSYVFWNASEPKEGQWDFTDNVDLDAWLALLKDIGMYALVRVGPYSCAEWEQGGYPAWLTIKPGMIQREMGPSLPFSDAHLAKVEAITAKYQIHRGGTVFMVQLENEHSQGWGTDQTDPYLKYLDDQARANGIEVPIFNSGLHHSQDPSGETPFPKGKCPWYSTEFWTGWIGKYGDMNIGTLSEKIRGTWKIIAFGGAGYNNYMVHGGSNLGYSGDSSDASYDYSAPIGEAGQFHNYYYPGRRAAYFAKSFNSLVTSSHDDPGLAKSELEHLRVTSRTSSGGASIIMVDNFIRKAGAAPIAPILPTANAYHAPKVGSTLVLETHISVQGTTLPHHGSLKVTSLEPSTIIVNFPWTKNSTFESICTKVLFRQTLGAIDYWVCYGPAGDTGEVTLKRQAPSSAPAQFNFTYPSGDEIKEIDLDSGDGHQAKLLIINTECTDRTWLAHDKIYIGPSFVLEDGRLEFPLAGGKATIYSASGKSQVVRAAVTAPALPTLGSWSSRDAAGERSPDFDDAKWLQSTGPQAMETYDSYQNRYGWYRTVFHRDAPGPVSLHLAGQSGAFCVFLNGHPATNATFTYGESATFDLPDAKAGDNILAILVKASARPKTTYGGPVGTRNARGIWGGVSFDKTPTPLMVDWKKWGVPNRDANAEDIARPDFDDSAWSSVDSATLSQPITLPRGNTWYRGTVKLTDAQVDSILETPLFVAPRTVQTKGTPSSAKTLCYVNGHLLDERVQDASKFLVSGQNSFLLEFKSRLGEETGKLALHLWHNSPLTKAPWHFHGGLDNLEETAVIGRATNWSQFLAHQPWEQKEPAPPALPAFWKCTFAYHQPAGIAQTLGLVTQGIKAGQVWLNGHNLGESPQKVLMYMPECWLKEGENDLVLFDLYGSKPDPVRLSRFEILSVGQ